MNFKRYFFTDSDGQEKGPFSETEIAQLVEQELLAKDVLVVDQDGKSLKADHFQRIVRDEDTRDLPPPTPAAFSERDQDKETANQSPRSFWPIPRYITIAMILIFLKIFYPDPQYRPQPRLPSVGRPHLRPDPSGFVPKESRTNSHDQEAVPKTSSRSAENNTDNPAGQGSSQDDFEVKNPKRPIHPDTDIDTR